ncbi:MAG: hypothetical protein ACRDCF_02970 [Mycoplasmoidaceae bacterium]
MAKKRQNNNNYDSNANDIDLIFNKIAEVSNSGNQQLFNLITDVEGKISHQLMDIKNNIINSNSGSSHSFTSPQTYIPPIVTQPVFQKTNLVGNNQLDDLINQIAILKNEISTNRNAINNIANNNTTGYPMGTIIDTNNKNADQLYSALNYLQNNISNSVGGNKALDKNFYDSLSALREEIYASQNSLYEAINMNANAYDCQFLYDEITKVNDDNTQNLFNYINTIEQSLKDSTIKTTNFLSSTLNNKISTLENKVDNSNQDLVSMDYAILDKVEENAIRQEDSLYNLRDELLYSNDNIIENTEYRTAELHNRLDNLENKQDDSLYNLRDELLYSNDNIIENTEYKTAELHNRLDELENRIHFSNEDAINMDHTILNKVDESSMIYNDLLVNLRDELLHSNNENLSEIMNVATQLREELLENDYKTTTHILNETHEINAQSQDQLAYINSQIGHIKEMLFNLNDIVGVNNDKFRHELQLLSKNSNNHYLDEINSLKELIKQKNDNNNDKYYLEIERLKDILKDKNNVEDNQHYIEEINRLKELINNNNQNINVQRKNVANNNNQNYIEEIPWDEWDEIEGDEMENYKNNSRRVVRIDESKLDMIYERVEQINYEINAKLYDLENNILGIIHDRDNEIDYKIAESSARSERLILSSIEEANSENENKYSKLRKEFLDKVTEVKDEFYDKNKDSIAEWNTNLSKSMEEMNKITSDIIDEMIQSQRRFEDLFMSVESKFNSFNEQLGQISSDQFAIYDENSNNFENIYATFEKHKKDIKKTHLMWDENNEKIESLKEKILNNTKEINKISSSTDYTDISTSLKQIDELKAKSEEFKTELTTIRANNEVIEKTLEKEKEAIDEKINNLYTDFHSLIDSFDEKIQYDLDHLTGESIAHIEKTSGEITEKIITLESQLDSNSSILENKMEVVNTEINNILSNLDNLDDKIQKETDEKLQALYQETLELVSNIQFENQNTKVEIEETNEYLSNKLKASSKRIDELQDLIDNTIIDKVKDERVDDLVDRVNEMKSFNIEAISKIEDIYTSWNDNNKKLEILEEVLSNQANEIQSLRSLTGEAFDDSFDRINVLYENENKIKNQIKKILKSNSILENKLQEEKNNLESKIEDVSTNIDTMILDLDTKVTEKTDNKMIKLYEETINMIDELKKENQSSFEEISIVNEGVSLNLFEVNSKIAELEHFTHLDPEHDEKFSRLFETIREIKDSTIHTTNEVRDCIESWRMNNEKIQRLEVMLENKSEEILSLANDSEMNFSDLFSKTEELYKSENSIKNEILAINAINSKLEQKLLEEKQNLDNKIKILNEELENKISTTESNILSMTDSKFDEINTNIDTKLITLHNEVMNLINELNESNQDLNRQISIIETDTLKTFDYLQLEIEELKNRGGISKDNPIYIEIVDSIAQLSMENKEQSDYIMKLQEELNKNVERSKSLKKILIAQSEEIQFIASSSDSAISTSFDRIHELFNSEKNIKEEIEKIYTENKGLKAEIEAGKEKLNERLINLTSEIDRKIADQENVMDSKIVTSEAKFDDKLMQVNFDLIEQISNIHYENISTLEKISDVEISFANKIQSNKDEIAALENLIKLIPDHNEKFEAIYEDIQTLFEYSEVSVDQMQEQFQTIKNNNKKINVLKSKLDKQGQEILALGEYTEGNLVDSYDMIHELHASESQIKEEIEQIYNENKAIKNRIITESSKNKQAISEKANELKEILAQSEIKILDKVEDDKKEIKDIITDVEQNILAETDKKIEDVKNDTSMKIDLLYQEMLSIISELNDGQNELIDEITNLDSFTRLSLMTVDSKISEIDFLVNKLPEEDPRFQKMLGEIEDLKMFSELTSNEISNINNVWKNNNKKLASLEDLLLAQSEELRLLSRSSEEVWNVSFDRIQELYESESHIKEEIENIFSENKQIINKLTHEKEKIHSKIDLINNDLLKEINSSEEKVLSEIYSSEERVIADIDTKVAKISSEIEEKISSLYNEMTDIINQVHLFSENNAQEINQLKEEVNNFVVDINNNLYEINEEINLLPEENPKFKPLIEKVEQLRMDNDTSMYEIKRIYDSWMANNKKLASLEDILLCQSEELRLLSRSSEEVWNLSFDRIQELYQSEKDIKEEIEAFYVETNSINTKLRTEKEKVLERMKEIQTDLAKEILDSKEVLSGQIDEKISKVSTDIEEKISSLYSEMTEIINEVHLFSENNANQINELKEEVNKFVVDINNNLYEINEEINLLPEENPKFKPLIEKVEQLRMDNDTSMYEIKRIYDSWIANNKKLASLEDLLLAQSEELRLLSRSSEEVWNLSFDRIQELYQSEKDIKEEIETLYVETNSIHTKLKSEKEKVLERMSEIQNDLSKEILDSKEVLSGQIDEKISKVSTDIEEKISSLYSEMTEIINEVHLFSENNANQINELKEEVNNFVVDINNNLYEINEEINLLPEENPKFKPLIEKVEQLRMDNDTSMYEIKKIYDSWIANNKKLASLEEILLTQSEELRLLSRSSEEVWNLSFDRIQELYQSEKDIKEEIETLYVETNSIHKKLKSEKEKVIERMNEIQNDLSKEILDSKEVLSGQIDEKISKVSTDIEEKISSLYSEMTEIINEVHLFSENNAEEISKLKDEVNGFVLEVNNSLFEINENINLLPEEDPKFRPLVEKVEQLRLDNDTSMHEIKKNYDAWVANNKKLASLEEILLTQSEELRLLSRSSEEVWNLSFDRIQELYQSERDIKQEIENIYSETNSIKNKLLTEKSKIKDRIKTIESDVNEKMFSMEQDLGEKIDTEIKNLSDSLTDDFTGKIDQLYNETLELVDSVKTASEESASRFEKINEILNEDLNNCNNNIVLLEEKLSSNLQVASVDLDHKIADIKELNVEVNNEIEKNKKLWLLNNFKLTSFIDLLENQSSELSNINSDYEPSPDLKRKMDELIKVDENLKFEIMEIMNENSKIEKNIKNQKTILVNKMDDLVSEVKKEIGEDFNSKVDDVYKNSMEFLENASVNINQNRESIDIIHNLVNNNYELANERIQKLVEDVNQKFDKKEGLEKINELAHINDSISEEISRIQKDWLLNNEKLKSLDNMLKDELKKQRYDIDSLDYKNNSLQENLLDILEMDGSINNEIESLKNKNLILEDNLFAFKKDFENNIKEIIKEIDNKIDSISLNLDPRKIIKEADIIKSIEEIVYGIVIKEINNLPFKKELLNLSEEDKKIRDEIKNIIHKLNSKNVKINQLIFDEIWHCNLKIESLIDEVMNISSLNNNNIIDLKKYTNTSSNEIKKVYKLWVTNNKKISELEDQIDKQTKLLINIGENSDISKINENISKLESSISSIESENNFISNQINEITKKQEVSIENLYNEILQITNEIDVNLYKRIDETLKNIDFKIEGNLKDKDEIKKLILKYSEEIIASELKTFIKMFEENNSELNKSHRAWLKNVQRISLLEDIIIEHEKGFKEASQTNTAQKDANLNQKEKEAIEKLIANHKKRLL